MAIDKLLLQIDTFKQNIINAEKINTKVSQSKVGWQIEHSLLVVIKIAEQLQNSNPKNYKAKFSVLKTIVFFTAKIPRGKAKAPKSVMPGAIQNPKQLEDYIALAKQKINILNSLNENNYFEHPLFGHVKLKAAIKFLQIHSNHHLKIIDDIIK